MTQNPNMQALALCELFFRDVKQKEKNIDGKYPGTDSYKKTVANNALKLLQAGLSFHELSALLAEATGTEEERNAYHIEENLRLKRKDFVVPTVHLQQLPKNECIGIGEFYFHPFLQVTSKPARYLYNETTFEMTRIEPEPFFLEMKSSFTVEDAVQYFIKETETNELHPERHVTQMKKLIQDVDDERLIVHLRVFGRLAPDLDFLVEAGIGGQDVADALGGNDRDEAIGISRVQDVPVDVQDADAGTEVLAVAEHIGVVGRHH